MDNPPSGFLNINKPCGPSSHDIISQLRRITGIRRIGHTGTLDPLATGVLPVCIGRATRLSEYLFGADKRYRAWIRLGESTNTYDSEGESLVRADCSHVTRVDIEVTLALFLGEVCQTVPRFSAVKRGGRKLYEMARKGEEFTPPSRTVQIHELHLLAWQPPDLNLDILCSAGTYIRSLAHDIGQQLAVGAHLTALERVTSGFFHLVNAIPPEYLERSPDWTAALIPPHLPFAAWLQLDLTVEESIAIRNGRPIKQKQPYTDDQQAITLYKGQLVAIVKALDSAWKPIKVLQPN